jgi:hypothetical protein
MGKNNLKAKKRVEKFDKLLFEIEKDLEELKIWRKKFEKLEKNVNQLSNYLQTDWLNDYNDFSKEKGLHVLGEDYPYNALMDFRENQKKILKQIVKNL